MQRLTPIEIQKQLFAKSFHGFNEGEVRAYLSLVSEEVEQMMQEIERLSRENAQMREQLLDHSERERMLKDTLLSAQKVSEDVKANAHKEASLIVKDAELLSERIVSQAMSRVGDLERLIQDLKLERKGARRRMQNLIEACQQMIDLDTQEEAGELPLTQLHKKRQDG
ncbi:MAG: DivIVA domain-containing protein [Thermoanaerobaculia bacterium]|nr:DivIVA domain-containing protein [Thermoanaerobaculia bacterium]